MTYTNEKTGEFAEMSGIEMLKQALVGLPCSYVDKAEHSWHFSFGNRNTTINLECPWRLSTESSIAYGNEDDGQQFGLSHPVDGVAKSAALLSNSPVASVEIHEISSDLSITFANGVCLEAFNVSSGHEGWNCSLVDGTTVVAQGGGNLFAWKPTGRDKGKQ